jgi:hypothetical protein
VHSLEMFGQSEEVEFLVRSVPISADAFETTGAVIEAMGEQSHLGVAIRDELAPVIDTNVSKFHAFFSNDR